MTGALARRAAICACVFAVAAQAQPGARRTVPKPSPVVSIPRLGDEVPAALLKRASAAHPCDTGEGRLDPCATLTEGRDRITVAWDAASHHVTYLYSTTLDTDNDIRVGDVLAIDPDSPITPFPIAGTPHRFVTSDWCDTDSDVSGRAVWCAVLVPVRPRSGKVVGFVQSLYLYLPEYDAEPMHKTTLRGSPTAGARIAE